MKLIFVGAAHEVTGSCHYLNACGKHILVDYGMEQGLNVFENCELPVQESLIDYVLLTHAHIDHSGMIPRLTARGFRGQVFATEATADLCSIMLRDCAHIQMQEAEWKNRKAKRSAEIEPHEPVYTMEDADAAIRRIVPCLYGQEIELCEGLKIRFTDVGHLLGSASIEVWATEGDITRKIVFSGDIGNKDLPLIKDPTLTQEADYVVMESTYGDRYHPGEHPDFAKELAAVLQETFDRGGNVVIPSFAVGRTQEILYFLRKIKAENMVTGHGNFPVYVDSPLAVEATNIFHKNEMSCFDEEAMKLARAGVNPIAFPGLSLTITSEESKEINFDTVPKVILSASGMCEAGRIRHHLKHNLWREECTILFVGYQAGGTLGRRILEGEKEVKLFGETIEVRARIESLKGISGHADLDGLLNWLEGFKKTPKRVFVVHGEDTVTEEFARTVEEKFGCPAFAPFPGGEADLITDEILSEGVRIPVKTKKPVQKKADAATERLLSAARWLMEVAAKCEGMANKDKAKFESQILNLADKWEIR